MSSRGRGGSGSDRGRRRGRGHRQPHVGRHTVDVELAAVVAGSRVAPGSRRQVRGAAGAPDPALDSDDGFDPADDMADDVELADNTTLVVPPTPGDFYVEDLTQAPVDASAVAVDVDAFGGQREDEVDTQGYVDGATGQYVPYEDAFFDGEYEQEAGAGVDGVGAPLAGRLVDWRGEPVNANDDVAQYYLTTAPSVPPACPPRPPPKPPAPPPQALAAAAPYNNGAGDLEAKGQPPAPHNGYAQVPDSPSQQSRQAAQLQAQVLHAQMQAQLMPRLAPPANWHQLSPEQQTEWHAQVAYVDQYNANVQRYYSFQQLALEQQMAYQAQMELRERELAAAQMRSSVQPQGRRGSGLGGFGGVLSKVATLGHSKAGRMMSGMKGHLTKLPGAGGVLGAGRAPKRKLRLKTVGKLVAAGTRAARKRRTADISRLLEVGRAVEDEAAESLFPKDCVNSKGGVMLSRTKVDYELDRIHPRRTVVEADDDGHVLSTRREPFSVCGTNTGSHCPCCHRGSDLGSLGLGMQLYFKFMKHMALVFFIMALISLPTLLVFMSAETDAAEQDEKTGLVGLLSMTTLGQLGVGRTLCQTAGSSGTVHIDCGEGSSIGLIEAYYGAPTGSCTCPPDQRPTPECPASVQGSTCAPPGGYCFLETSRKVATPSGLTFDGGPCCGASQNLGEAVFTDLDIRTSQGCNSNVAQVMAAGICLGQESCTLSGAPLTNQTWPQPTDVDLGAGCNAGVDKVAAGVSSAGNNTCTSNFLASGNFTSCPARLRLTVVARCFDVEVPLALGDGLVFKKGTIAQAIGVLDFFATVAFILGILWLRRFESEEGEAHDLATLSVDDYTVVVRNLPPHESVPQLEQDLKAHMEAVLDAAKPSPLAVVISKLIGDEFSRPIKIADVNCGTSVSGKMTRALDQRGRILKSIAKKERRRLQKLAREALKRGSADGIDRTKRTENEKKTLMTLLAKLDAVDDEITDMEQRDVQAVSAYVTFEDEEGRLRAMRTFGSGPCARLCQKKRTRLRGSALDVRKAPQPSDIIWENLGVTTCSRFFRTLLTFTVTVLLLGLSIVLVFLAEDQKRKAKLQFPPADCASLLDVTNATLVVQDVKWRELNLTTGGVGRLECFCKQLLFSQGPNALLNTVFNVPLFGGSGGGGGITGYAQEAWCVDWLTAFTRIQLLTYGASVMVLVVNGILRKTILLLVTFERHRSNTSAMVSRFSKLFTSTGLNIGVVMLLVNAHLDVDVELLRRGEHSDVNPPWFFTVGTSLLLTMCINLVVPHAWPATQLFMNRCFQRLDRGCTSDRYRTKKLSQKTLENLYRGPSFLLAERYAQHCVFICVAMTYSTGMPILYAIACLSFIITYWVDKYLVLTLYRSPPHYTDEFSGRARTIMPLAIVMHLCMGIWTLGNTNVFAPDKSLAKATAVTEELTGDAGSEVASALDALTSEGSFAADRLSSSHVLPLVVLLIVFVVFQVLYHVLWRVAASTMMTLVASCKCCTHHSFEFLPHYFDAIPSAVKVDAIVNHVVKPNVFKAYCAGLQPEDFATRGNADGDDDDNDGNDDALASLQTPRRSSVVANPAVMSLAGMIEERTNAPTNSKRERRRRKSHIKRQKWLDRQLDKLSRHAELHGERSIHGLHTYDIHANPDYRSRFGMDLPIAEHMLRGNFWTQRGTEWSRRGVDVLRVPRRPFRWELHKLRATVKQAVRDTSTSPQHGSVAATLALALRGSSSPRRRSSRRMSSSPTRATSPRGPTGHAHSRSAVPASGHVARHAAALKDSRSDSDRGVRAAERASSTPSHVAPHRRVRDLQRSGR